MIIAVICIIVVLLIIILWAVFTNNSLIAKKNRVKQCRSGICVVLKQRNNLIPNLVVNASFAFLIVTFVTFIFYTFYSGRYRISSVCKP